METPNLEEQVNVLKAEIHTLKCKAAVDMNVTQPTTLECGAYISELRSFDEEFKQMIEKMNELLATEKKLMTGVEFPTYESILQEIECKPIENELSMDKATIQ